MSEISPILQNLESYEEVPIRTYKGTSNTIPVFKVSTNPSGTESLRKANYFRHLGEKYERIFYQKEHAYICCVDGQGLEIRIINLKKVAGNVKNLTSQARSGLSQEDGVRISFDSPISRDIVFVDYKDSVSFEPYA